MALIVLSLSYKAYGFGTDIMSFFRPQPNLCREERSLPVVLNIPSLAADLSVEQSYIRNGEWEISKKGVSHLNNSAQPGTNGNIVIYGHNTVTQLGNLLSLQDGAYIIIETKDGGMHSYVVTKKEEVSPREVGILKSNGSEALTLYTCIGFADSMRLVVHAVPAKDTASVNTQRSTCKNTAKSDNPSHLL